MKTMTCAEIRQAFLEYFAKAGHSVVPSSPLVPGNDPSLLFTNAGMVQFKDVFLGQDKRAYTRATSAQCCMRAGGKHNDLENVGYTARHHTFFEMMGNFSFGDYFKREAIDFAWTFLTEHLKLPAEKLWVTVFDDDKEAEAIWLNELGHDPKRFSRCGAKDNFWSMGETGPCGPCTEIFYDHGPSVAGGPPGSPDEDGDRYVEIWNLVFMQYDRKADGSLTPLPKPSVDTGMGLERIAAVMQGVHSNYEIDIFQALINAAAAAVGCDDLGLASLKVIADHIRACSFLIAEGVMPGNEGQAYVLRRIIRRAARHGHKLGQSEPFFYRLVPTLTSLMGEAYPVLIERQTIIEQALLQEEQQFANTLQMGMNLLEAAMAEVKADKRLAGDIVFKLYDTYGFPYDLTADIAREHGLTIDQAGYDQCMTKQRETSRAASQFKTSDLTEHALNDCSEFIGYEHEDGKSTVKQVIAQDDGSRIIVLAATPFYAESGGQVGDQGLIESADARFRVINTTQQQQAILHHGRFEYGEFKTGDSVNTMVDHKRRQAIRLNHSATHLLHAALRRLLGSHVSQKGSLVDDKRLRFDFSHHQALSLDELREIEQLVNQEIRKNHCVQTTLMSPDAAKQAGAMALFGEKYSDEVRVLSMGEFSKELCGGTHVARTGDIGLFKLTSESGVAAGIRRIEAITGETALAYVNQQEDLVKQVAATLKSKPQGLLHKLEQHLQKLRETEKNLKKLQTASLSSASSQTRQEQMTTVNNIPLLMVKVNDAEVGALRAMMDQLKTQCQRGVIVLSNQQADKLNLLIGVTKDLTSKVHAGEMIKVLAELIGGRGGGRPDFAQAGGTDLTKLDKLQQAAHDYLVALG